MLFRHASRAGHQFAPAIGAFEVKGEITLLIAKEDGSVPRTASSEVSVAQRVKKIMAEEKVDEKSALKKVAKERGIGKSEAYRELQRTK